MARTTLSRDDVVDEAESLVDNNGSRQLTMALLARRLGVQGPSLYHHVGGVDGLLAEIQVRSIADLGRRLQRAAMGRAGADCFRALAQTLDTYALEHPGLCELALSAPIDEQRVHAATESMREVLEATIRSFGIPEATLDLQLMCLAPLYGALALGRSGAIQRPAQQAAIYRRMTDLVIQMLESEGNA